jgi:hypothetical protein
MGHSLSIGWTQPAPREATLLELVCSAGRESDEPETVVARVVGQLESGRVRLCGNFRTAPVAELRSALASHVS